MIKLSCFFIFFLWRCLAIDLDVWEQFDSDVTYLAINGQRMMKVGFVSPSLPDGYPLYSWLSGSQSWALQSGMNAVGVQVALTLDQAYIRDINDNLKSQTGLGNSFVNFGPTIKDLKAGSDNFITLVSNQNHFEGDFEVILYNGDTSVATRLTKGAIKVGITSLGTAWLIKGNGDIYKEDSLQIGTARDITIGNNDIPYIVSEESADEGYVIKKWNVSNNAWDIVIGVAGISVALDANNNPYIVTNGNKAFRRRGVTYNFCPGKRIFM